MLAHNAYVNGIYESARGNGSSGRGGREVRCTEIIIAYNEPTTTTSTTVEKQLLYSLYTGSIFITATLAVHPATEPDSLAIDVLVIVMCVECALEQSFMKHEKVITFAAFCTD